MGPTTFQHLSLENAGDFVHAAQKRVIFCAPGLQQPLAAALVNARKQLGREAVRVVLDVNDNTIRMGYGDFDAVSLLTENDVDVWVEPGLRTCVLVCDDAGFAFFTPPMLVEMQDDKHVGANAMTLLSEQVHTVATALMPQAPSPRAIQPVGAPATQPRVVPELGKVELAAKDLEQVRTLLDANPPQKFDLARRVNVFNAFIEFVELRLTGLHIARHTVQLPQDLVLALRDDATAKRLLTTFRLVSEDSKVAKEAAEIDQKVRALRDLLTRSLGDGLGNVILRSKRKQFSDGVDAIKCDIKKLQVRVQERLQKEIDVSRKKLVDGLLPAMKKNPPIGLTSQLSGKPPVDVLRRYLDDELERVFPQAVDLVGEMKLEWTPKGVTYETLNNPEFQQRVRKAFPYEDWDKPFREFEAAPAAEQARFNFDP